MNGWSALVKLTILCCGIFICTGAAAGVIGRDARLIAEEAEHRKDGFNDYTARVTMILRNSVGQESRRDLVMDTLERESDGDMVLITFLSPGDINGTALLNYTNRNKDDERWLYLPALNRVKRIASQNKSGPFMGSDFSYEDLSSPETDKFTYMLLNEEHIAGQDCYVVERKPKDHDTGYSRQLVWYDKLTYRVHKIEFYDRKDSLLKTQINSEFKLFSGSFWYPMNIVMSNHQLGQSTELIYREFKTDQRLEQRHFHPAQLSRRRR